MRKSLRDVRKLCSRGLILAFLTLLPIPSALAQHWVLPRGLGGVDSNCSPGDFTGDGRPDFVVADPLFSTPVSGLQLWLFGFIRGFDGVDMREVWSQHNAIANSNTPPSTGSYSGGVSPIGDINADGIPDILERQASVPTTTPPPSDLRVRSGTNGSIIWTSQFTNPALPASRNVHSSVAIGDVNGDGASDLVATASAPTSSFSIVPTIIEAFSGATGVSLWSFVLSPPGVPTRWRALAVGDIDGDGRGDFAAVLDPPAFGTSSLYSGASGALIRQFATPTDNYGLAGISLGDLDGDGTNDFAIGGGLPVVGVFQAPALAGRVDVFSGATGTTLYSLTFPTNTNYGNQFGKSMAAVGDLDGDGKMDFAIGSPDGLGAGPGFIRVVSGVNGSTLQTLTAPNGAMQFGTALAAVADLGCDGRTDLIVTDASNIGLYHLGAVCSPNLAKLMLTEVAFGSVTGVEITNFDWTTAASLAGWSLRWQTGPSTEFNALLGTLPALGFQQSAVVLAAGSAVPPELPLTVPFATLLPALPGPSQGFRVGLVDPSGAVVDEVALKFGQSSPPPAILPGLGHAFRGSVDVSLGIGGQTMLGIERIFGLDSDGGSDWTVQPDRSLGLRSRSSGTRGFDPQPIRRVLINELDNTPDYIELLARQPESSIDLQGWTLVLRVNNGTVPLNEIHPFPNSYVVLKDESLVIGNDASPPPELPSNSRYIDLSALNPPGGVINLDSEEFEIVLYDRLGRAVDVVRASGSLHPVAMNDPRTPCHWSEFRGLARRGLGGDRAIGRHSSTDTHQGSDFKAIFTRSMGLANPSGSFQDPLGAASPLDFVASPGAGGGLTFIWNAGGAAAGGTVTTLISLVHSNGAGPFFNLGADALTNFLTFGNLPPFQVTLDALGSARFDLSPASIPPGIDADLIAILMNATGTAVVGLTPIVEFDT